MTRHFLVLYLMIVVTLAGASWCEDRIVAAYGTNEPPEVETEILRRSEIAGADTLRKLSSGNAVSLQESNGQTWTLKQIDSEQVLALKTIQADPPKGRIDWALTFGFYAIIALVLMVWIWPLTRDLRALEGAVAQFGDRNWRFQTAIRPHSQVHPLAQTFQMMARRIDGLISSHKDLTNAISHEIKTPLSRMQFDLEIARQATSAQELRQSLDNIESDVGSINELVVATLGYAVLERAEMPLNIGIQNLRTLLPAIVESARRGASAEIQVDTTVQGDASRIICDLHLIDTVIKNLLSNAFRYARSRVQVTFSVANGQNNLTVEDDGPGVPPADRTRVFTSFVQLEQMSVTRTGFGLGLAIVARAMEWHQGEVFVTESPWGGASFRARWPSALQVPM